MGGTAYVETKTLLASGAELAVAACAESSGFENIAIGARKESLGSCQFWMYSL